MSDTPNLALPLVAAAQAQKHVTHNEALAMLDALVQLGVISRTQASPPAGAQDGARYLVPAGGTGAFAGKANQIALFDGGLWRFLLPRAGWVAHVAGENMLMVFDGAGWMALGQFIGQIDQLAALGIGTASDAVNRLAVSAQGALMTARRISAGGTGDMRLTIEKEASARTASLLFQTDFSGRAEIGLAGDDSLRVKVSADGAIWRDAIAVNGTTGQVSFPGGVSGLEGGGAGALGQCRLDVWGGALRLSPFNGNQLTVNGAYATVPGAGVTLAATGTTAGTLYYIYATASGGAVNALEASTTAPATHTDGTRIKAGDATRALVGMAVPDTGPAWVDSNAKGLVASHFNRRDRVQQITTATVASTTSHVYVELSAGMRAEWLTWADEAIRIEALTSGNVTGGSQQGTGIGIDSATNVAEDHYHTTPNVATVPNVYGGTAAEGRHDSRILVRSLASATVTIARQTQRVVTRR